MQGTLFIFSAPSGAGKTTIVHHLMKLELGLSFSISATTRPPREGELNGREYHFLTADQFREQIREGAFVEWEEVYPGQYYGTLRSELERIWQGGEHALFDIDVKGGLNLKKQFGEAACAVFIQPPSLEVLEERLRNRNTDGETSLRERLGKAAYEMQFASQFDHILVNDSLGRALAEAESIVRRFLGR